MAEVSAYEIRGPSAFLGKGKIAIVGMIIAMKTDFFVLNGLLAWIIARVLFATVKFSPKERLRPFHSAVRSPHHTQFCVRPVYSDRTLSGPMVCSLAAMKRAPL